MVTKGLKRSSETQMGRSGPIFLGLTGSLASGKSTTLKVFKKRGWTTASADDIVAQIYRAKGLTKETILKKYGHSKAGLKRLERWIHPLVAKQTLKIMKKSKAPVCIEVPLLFEARFDRFFDATVFVYASKADRIRRMKKRSQSLKHKGMSLKLFQFLDRQQWPAKTKMKLADYVIKNKSKKKLKKAAVALAKKLETKN